VTDTPPDDLDAAVAQLYGGAPDAFVATRKRLAGALRADGRRDEAAAVAKLRKPSRLAWALDAAVAADPSLGGRLAAAARAVADAQEGGGDVRGAIAELRATIDAVADAARRAAGAGGHPVDRTMLTPGLLAIVGEPAALEALEAGRLVDVPSGGGFGPALDVPIGPAPDRDRGERRRDEGRAARPAADRTADADDAAAPADARAPAPDRHAVSAARRAVTSARADAASAATHVSRALAARDDAAERADAAARAAQRARELQERAERELADAERRQRAADEAAQRAQAELDALES
jgi:hypothetical protein